MSKIRTYRFAGTQKLDEAYGGLESDRGDITFKFTQTEAGKPILSIHIGLLYENWIPIWASVWSPQHQEPVLAWRRQEGNVRFPRWVSEVRLGALAAYAKDGFLQQWTDLHGQPPRITRPVK
jgi:hypothetical protein